MSSAEGDENRASALPGTIVFAVLLLIVLGASFGATAFELFSWGDIAKMKTREQSDLLKEAAKFRRLI